MEKGVHETVFDKELLDKYRDIVNDQDPKGLMKIMALNLQVFGTAYDKEVYLAEDEEDSDDISFNSEVAKINEIFDRLLKRNCKTKCIDLFQNVKVNDEYIYEQQPIRKMVKFKYKRKNIEKKAVKINQILQMKILVKELYLEMLIKRIELNKELFVMDVE